jgi:transglutaminase-like putative cysteine protease
MAKNTPKHNPPLVVEDAVKALSFLIGITGALAAARYTGPAYSLAFFSLCAVAMLFEYQRRFLIPRWLLTLATVAFVGVSLMRMSLQNFVQPAVEALMILLAIKFLEEKKFRDYMQIYVLSVFLLAGSALLSLDIVFLAYFLALLFLLAAAMVLLTYYVEDRTMKLPLSTIRGIVLKSLFIPLASIPLALVLFVVLPRTSYPLFNLLSRGGGAATGFSDTVGLGQVAAIQEDAAVIMRVRMQKVDDDLLYWRGIVLDHFDGESWQRTTGNPAGGNRRFVVPGRTVSQTIYLDPYGNRYLFALDKPLSIRIPDVGKSGDLTYVLANTITRKLKYEAHSVLSDTLPENDIDRDRYLQVPATGMEKIRKLAHSLAAGQSREKTAEAILHFLKNGEYTYSLTNLPVSRAPLDDFLFQHKYGNCEYFASAMAVMLRLSGIPSRLVGGYRGGFYNETAGYGYYLIPDRNAHVWVEAYFNNRGWVRMDPTPAAPESFVSPSGRGLFFRVRLFFDAIDYFWTAFIINYDLEKQFSLINKLRDGVREVRFKISFDKDRASTYILVFLGAVSLVIGLYTLRGRVRKAAEERLLALFLGKMKRRGYIKSRPQGLEEFVALVKEDGLRERARSFVEQFEAHYYRDRKLTKEEARRLRRMLNEL